MAYMDLKDSAPPGQANSVCAESKPTPPKSSTKPKDCICSGDACYESACWSSRTMAGSRPTGLDAVTWSHMTEYYETHVKDTLEAYPKRFTRPANYDQNQYEDAVVGGWSLVLKIVTKGAAGETKQLEDDDRPLEALMTSDYNHLACLWGPAEAKSYVVDENRWKLAKMLEHYCHGMLRARMVWDKLILKQHKMMSGQWRIKTQEEKAREEMWSNVGKFVMHGALLGAAGIGNCHGSVGATGKKGISGPPGLPDPPIDDYGVAGKKGISGPAGPPIDDYGVAGVAGKKETPFKDALDDDWEKL